MVELRLRVRGRARAGARKCCGGGRRSPRAAGAWQASCPRAGQRRGHRGLSPCPVGFDRGRAALRGAPSGTAVATSARAGRPTNRARAACASALLHSRPAGTSRMQSTGQGGRHSSQPVHQALSTVCMRFGPPAIAATGQASRHSAQPMQRDSSMRARRSGPSLPCAGSSGERRARGDAGEGGDAGRTAGGAAVDRLARRDRLGVGTAGGESAAPALRLRQCGVDAIGQRGRRAIGQGRWLHAADCSADRSRRGSSHRRPRVLLLQRAHIV